MPEVSYSDVQNTVSGKAPAVLTSLSPTDNAKLGQSSDIQYTEPKPPVTLGERVAQDVEKPFVQAQHTMGSGLYWLGTNLKDQTPFGALGDRVARVGIIQQERASQTLKEKFSNFTPNMLDELVGAVPTVAGFLGLATIGPEALAAGGATMAVGMGAGVAANEFGKFKDQGRPTDEANKLALAIGVPVGGVMALGFAKAGDLVAPWFKNMLAQTIAEVVAPGAVALGTQAGVQDMAEFATGAEPFQGKESVVKTLTDIAHGAIFGGVLSGAVGMPYVLKQHNALVAGLHAAGVGEKAPQVADDILGQGAHVLTDAIEKHLDYSKDELKRVQTTPSGKPAEVRPNILERGGIPKDLFYPPVDPLPKEAPEVVELSKDFKYVKLEPMDLTVRLNDKATAEDIRYVYTGNRDKQIARIVHLNQDVKKLVPDPQDRAAMFMDDRSSDFMDIALKNPMKAAEILHRENFELSGQSSEKYQYNLKEINSIAEKIRSLQPLLEKLVNPTEAMRMAMQEGDRYYAEQGKVSAALGTIDEIRENYHSSRLYKASPLADYVKNFNDVVRRFSAHSLQRYYQDNWQALAAGKEFKTMDYADALLAHGEEQTEVNAGRQLMDAMGSFKPFPLGMWVNERGLPEDWQQVGTARKLQFLKDRKTGEVLLDENDNPLRVYKVFAAPRGIANGLRALVDPNYLKLIPGYATLDKMQGTAKTGLLSASFFHHATFATTQLSSLNGISNLAKLGDVLKNDLMSEPGFRAMELDLLGAGGQTTIVHMNQDLLKKLNEGNDLFTPLLKAPVVKQMTQVLEANTKLLFDGIQRYSKVVTYGENMAKWEGEHPSATDEERLMARRGFARATNNLFGGQNWEAIGVSKTQLAMLRAGLLAPDWVVSNLLANKNALTQKSIQMSRENGKLGFKIGVKDASKKTESMQSRGTIVTGILGGILVNNILNYMRTGHSTFENKKGHLFETEFEPDVYTNTIRGAQGELLKILADVMENPGAPGAIRYAQGKLSPLLGAAVTAISGRNYYGADIWKGDNSIMRNINGAWEIVSHFSGVPMGITGDFNYHNREDDRRAMGYGLITSGLGRFSKASEGSAQKNQTERVIQAFRNGNTEFVEHLINRGELSEEQAQKLQIESEKSDVIRHFEHMKIEAAIKLYGQSKPETRTELDEALAQKYERFQSSKASPNEKKRVEKLFNDLRGK